MENAEVSSSSASPIVASETRLPINSDAKLYMTHMVIQLVSDDHDHFNPTIINVDVFDSEMPGSSNILVFEKISARSEWKYEGTLALTKETTLTAGWDGMEDFGFVHLTKSELGKLKESEGSPNQLSEIIHEFITEGDGPQIKLIFSVEVVPADRSAKQRGIVYATYEEFAHALFEDPETVLAWVFESPQTISSKTQLLNFVGNTFRNRFHKTSAQRDIDNSVLAYNMSIQLLPVTDANFGDLLCNYGISVLMRYQLTGNPEDINEAVSSLRKAVQSTAEGHAILPAILSNLGIALQARFKRTGDVADISEGISSQQKSVKLTPDGHADLPARISNLGVSLQTRFQHTWDLDDIAEAISFQRKSVQLTPEGHANFPTWLNNLGVSLQIRFERTKNLADISEAISSQQKSVQLTPEGHADLPDRLNNLSISLMRRFEIAGSLADMSEAISSAQKSVKLTPMGHADLPNRLNNLGISLRSRFRRIGDFSDISETISIQQKSVKLTPDGHVDLPGRLSSLGDSFRTRFQRTGNLADISEAISLEQKSIQLSPEGHANFPTWLNNLGTALLARFECTGSQTDLSEAISLQRKSVQMTPVGHVGSLPNRLSNLGVSLQRQFELTGNLADISEAISSQQKSVQLTPEGHVDLPGRLDNLGISLRSRSEHTGDFNDISESISLHQKSVQLTPEGHAGLPSSLCNLSVSLQICFERTGTLDHVSEAISFMRKSVELTPEAHADLPARLSNLGGSLHARFQHTEDLADISAAIASQKKCVHLTSEGHPGLPGFLNNLGNCLQARFQRTGNLVDLSEAITARQKSVQLTPEGHAELPSRLNNLGHSLERRFQREGNLADISEAISFQRKSVQLTPKGHAKLSSLLNSLGQSLRSRSRRTEHLTDISEAILFQQKSIQLTSEDHADLPARLCSLGASLRERSERTGDLTDLSDAISSQQKSVQLTPEGHASLPVWLNNLGISLQVRFQRTGNPADILEAISFQQKSIQITPVGHAFLPSWLINLGNSFAVCYKHTSNARDIQSALSRYRLSATSVSGPPSIRLEAAQLWAYLAQKTDQSQLLEAYQTSISLISQVAGLDQTIQNRYINLVNISELSASSAAAAIDMGKYDLALEWLEQGRCLVWSQLNDLRAPIDDLRAGYPELAGEVLRVSRALENAGSRAEPVAFTTDTTMTTKMSIQDETHTHLKLAQEWDQLLPKVRAIPQFEDFLRPPSASALLQHIPVSGHVIAVNIHKSRSDALVLTFGAKEPLHITLPDFPYEKADSLRQDLKALLHDSGIRMRQSEQDIDITRGSRRHVRGVANILRQLWVSVVKPILDGLGYSKPASKIPRIWWCVTGPLAFLPIHAAGIYAPSESAHTCLSDFAVSSYTPTVRSLVERQQSSQSREVNSEKMGLVMISQPDTPKLARIPGTTLEVKTIKRLLDNRKVHQLCLESGEATIDKVKTSMDAYTCIHFACHASQNTTKPLQSGFYLYDGRLELSSIIKEHLTGADLAFLSACQTSTGDEKLSEEAVHLAGGMLAAGYRGVVATMWSIKDNYGPKLAEEFYKDLLNRAVEEKDNSSRFGGDNAARALHYATQQLRTTLDNSESSLLTWVPFVHFGL